MNDPLANRARIIHHLDELLAELSAGSSQAIEEARAVLARIALRGSQAVLTQVIYGITLAWNEQQGEWDKLME